jgi:phenylacetate-CoA ligase
MISSDPGQTLLRECFRNARDHPFYREHLRGIDNHRDAPITDKQALLERLLDFAPGDEGRGVYLVRSGGSTSVPLIFPVDIGENHAQRRALAEHLKAFGVFDARTVALNIFGYSDLYRTAAIFDDLLERCDATTLPMSAHARYEDIASIARRFRPTHLLGTPSKLALFARFLLDSGQTLRIPRLLYGGEILRDSTQALMRDAFGTQQFWSLYGGAETGIWAWCDASRNPGLFRILPGIMVEVASADVDGYGALVVTNGYRTRFPLFRYRVGDVGRLVERDGEWLLELRGRDSRSFQFAEMTYDLELFTSLAGAADGFQIQLRFDADGRDMLEFLLVDDGGACSAEVIAGQLAQLLSGIGSQGATKVCRVHRDALYQDPATTKTPAIVDFRR